MLLMGYPMDHMRWTEFSNAASCQQKKALKLQFVILSSPSVCHSLISKELHRFGGNMMALRAILAAMCIVLKSMNPDRLSEYLDK